MKTLWLIVWLCSGEVLPPAEVAADVCAEEAGLIAADVSVAFARCAETVVFE